MSRPNGFVLVNALVLVAALAATSVFLLSRSEAARARRLENQEATQLSLYLDAFESLGQTILNADRGGLDHPGEAWARATFNVEVDRGRVAGSFYDLQGRFNVNWLSNPEDEAIRAAFDRLALRIGLSPQTVQTIVEFVTPDAPVNNPAYARADPAVRPVGGPVLLLAQLKTAPGMRAEEYAAIRTHMAALPGNSGLNVNTTTPEVIASLLPTASAGALDLLMQERLRSPFISVEDFILRLGAALGPAAIADIDDTRFSVGSEWFGADVSAALGDRVRARHSVFERLPVPHGVRVAYRLDQQD